MTAANPPSSRHPARLRLVIGGLAILVLVSLGLSLAIRLSKPSLEDIQKAIDERMTASGSGGLVKAGPFEGRVPYYRQGHLMVYAPQSAYPGKKRGPACLLLFRLNPGSAWRLDSGLSTDGESLEISPAQEDRQGNEYRFTYTVKGDPPLEDFLAGGQHYQPENGRVFLIDLVVDPPIVRQIADDLAGLFARPDATLSGQDLQRAVDQLASNHQEVADLLAILRK
jgi:hypothetical protein